MGCQSEHNHGDPFFSSLYVHMDSFQFMDSVVKVNDHGDCSEDDAFDEQPLSSGSSDVYDVFGEPQILPRVDEEYQVEIPPQFGSDSLWLTNNPAVAENSVGSVHDFLVGLTVPIMWIADKVENIHHEPQEAVVDSPGVSNKDESLRSECIEETHIFLEGGNLEPKAEPRNYTLDNGANLGELAKVDMEQEMKIKMHDLNGGKGYCLVPGSLGDSWNDIEEHSFILGLYIFGKNFVHVKKFVGNKEMGDILSFYYGRFYRSDRYRRWSECRKMRSRKCIYGQRIFTGLRQQEFFSRLLPHVSEECQNTLMEVSKAFGDGKMLLEEYVFTLKALVGLSVLVEAVGIGKEKQDLTGIMEPLKSTQVAPVRPEIPIGKACSTLTPLEIVNFITGDFRLSKARSSDLFWEAVWPRLLARGWHSEQPNSNECAAGSKHSLVFLIPGITKFSKRKLVKGKHYFDSVSDVLSKVASDPVLLELEIEDRGKEENGWTDETKVDQEDFPDQQRHYYLKPRTPNHNADLLKFTVVDTSLTNGKTIKVRELRSLPSGVLNTSTSESDSEDDDLDHSEETMDKSQSADTSCFDMDDPRATNNSFDQEIASNSLEELENNLSTEVFRVTGFNHTNVPVNIPNDLKTSIRGATQPKKAIKRRLNRRMGAENKNCLPSVTKQHQKLHGCSQTETNSRQLNILQDPTLKQEIPCSSAKNPDFCGNPLSQIDKCLEKKTSTSLSKGSLTIGCEGILGDYSHEVTQSGTLIDLNLPIPPDTEADDLLMTQTKKEHVKTSKELDDPSVVKLSNCVANSEQQPNIKCRRQSMRSRPPTIKALEALAFGFLDPKQKRKSRDASPHENPMLRPSQRARVQERANENIGTSVVDLKAEERANGVCHSNNGDLMTKLQV
ncbi:hypothetical protein I3760_02G084600 [Carya illinoinensis]|uniref:SANT domain-containing protein n=2 Tax=Carya illinoinensis TaxID=32201 RepID=A0A8T1RCG0_CARIL|nr:uncharacterized protein LOC122300439 isoform X1 [Carya illinoinensis]KAG2721490.1 hypothetical protein I3760_02G084600 [Carya illinoinensis]KAG6664305.1 hypothetical protein CIPAW_02G084000 [Carya illinoinensis]